MYVSLPSSLFLLVAYSSVHVRRVHVLWHTIPTCTIRTHTHMHIYKYTHTHTYMHAHTIHWSTWGSRSTLHAMLHEPIQSVQMRWLSELIPCSTDGCNCFVSGSGTPSMVCDAGPIYFEVGEGSQVQHQTCFTFGFTINNKEQFWRCFITGVVTKIKLRQRPPDDMLRTMAKEHLNNARLDCQLWCVLMCWMYNSMGKAICVWVCASPTGCASKTGVLVVYTTVKDIPHVLSRLTVCETVRSVDKGEHTVSEQQNFHNRLRAGM